MDDRHFDSLVMALARHRNRRSLIKGLLGIGGAATIRLAGVRQTDAARRGTAPASAPHCPGVQTWNGTDCVCADGSAKCGPDCCADGVAVCCDNACCYGTCYGEELCCPSPQEWCAVSGECCADGLRCCAEIGCVDPSAGGCCEDADCLVAGHDCDICDASGQCVPSAACCVPTTCPDTYPEDLTGCEILSDGCDGSMVCGCPAGWGCVSGDMGNICVNNTATCLPGVTECEYYNLGFSSCLVGEADALCLPSVSGGDPVCVSYPEDPLMACLHTCSVDADCEAYGLTGEAVCVGSCFLCGGGGQGNNICAIRA
jgi:hypothetical protein